MIGVRWKIAMIAIGGAFLFFGYQESKLRGLAKDEPQAISASRLIRSGYGDNAHVKVTNIVPIEFHYVYVEKKGKWETVWLPAVAQDSEYIKQFADIPDDTKIEDIPLPQKVGIMLKLNDARNETDVSRISLSTTLEGLIINEIESLGSEETKILKESYPRVNFKKCIILEVGRKPKSGSFIALFFGAGICFAGGGLFLMFGMPGAKKASRRKRARRKTTGRPRRSKKPLRRP